LGRSRRDFAALKKASARKLNFFRGGFRAVRKYFYYNSFIRKLDSSSRNRARRRRRKNSFEETLDSVGK